ncbi:26S proteasome non-ATPase regulatory subunit 9-like [Sycon ciliatum]|uniref:26S proteasome non-ATPase regulatory subunit 9-like n=1 Tax=Sycon ciliatum TaxID=27933 RepID=UPI0020A86562|eukprot:scpid91461/ scgid12075/ 26S proteasome non-ATPase regulatory subunit 9; 26S proteasome regulatory subunit p27
MSGGASSMESVQALIIQRDDMEEKVKSNLELLNGYGVGMDAPLVDREGYPRQDLDLPAIRAARNTVHCLRNDIRHITLEIEKGLLVVHQRAREAKEELARAGASAEEQTQLVKKAELLPFADIQIISDGSPAKRAGLAENDLLLKFGSITATNFSGMQSIAKLVSESEDRPLQVALLRHGSRKDVILKPQRWRGQGLLGCKIAPLPKK